MSQITKKKLHLRCAVYTRKSSEEGLEQDFNSLDAQREACAAYVKTDRIGSETLAHLLRADLIPAAYALSLANCSFARDTSIRHPG